jgi:hypothetical protein
MKMLSQLRRWLAFGMLSFVFASCVTVHTPEVTQALESLQRLKLDSITRVVGSGIVTGVNDSLLPEPIQKKLNMLVGSLASTLVASAQDTLLDAKTRAKIDSTLSGIVATLTGKKTRLGLDSLIGSVGRSARLQIGLILQDALGKKTQDEIAAMLNRVIGDSTTMRIDTLMNHLLGTYPQRSLQALIDTINRGLKQSGTEVKSTSNAIIWSLVGGIVVVLGIATWLYIQKRKVQQVSEVVTYSIHNIPDKSAYDELTHRISDEAKRRKVEPVLQHILEEQGLRGSNPKPPIQYKSAPGTPT